MTLLYCSVTAFVCEVMPIFNEMVLWVVTMVSLAVVNVSHHCD